MRSLIIHRCKMFYYRDRNRFLMKKNNVVIFKNNFSKLDRFIIDQNNSLNYENSLASKIAWVP